MIVPVILSGGSGTRLWPLSRELYPKQLLGLCGSNTMLQETVLRLEGLDNLSAPVVVCNNDHRFMVAEQLRQIDQTSATIILEPCGRNTAPAVALAALQAVSNGEDPLLLILPADHVIKDSDALRSAVRVASMLAQNGTLLTFGIVPTGPETGYGYIRVAINVKMPLQGESPLSNKTDQPKRHGISAKQVSAKNKNQTKAEVYKVAEFTEKPDLKSAERFVTSGDYFWNSGMFLFKASVYLEELKRHEPEMLSHCILAWEKRHMDLDFIRVDQETFDNCPSKSVDYAVMEKTKRAAVVPLDAGWNDVGSWAALWNVADQDEQGNVIKGDVISIDNQGTYLHADRRLIAGIGLRNMVVVETADAVLVAAKDRVQDVRQAVEQLRASKRQEHLLHRRVNRPWGAYESLDSGLGYLVKRITVHPGDKLSLQRHQFRSEHWVVVRGTARVVCDDQILTRNSNESIYIPIGAKHRLENPGPDLLEIIEVQTGSYLSEDDIERFEDSYGR